MRERKFPYDVGCSSGCLAAWPLRVHGQQSLPVIGFLTIYSFDLRKDGMSPRLVRALAKVALSIDDTDLAGTIPYLPKEDQHKSESHRSDGLAGGIENLDPILLGIAHAPAAPEISLNVAAEAVRRAARFGSDKGSATGE